LQGHLRPHGTGAPPKGISARRAALPHEHLRGARAARLHGYLSAHEQLWLTSGSTAPRPRPRSSAAAGVYGTPLAEGRPDQQWEECMSKANILGLAALAVMLSLTGC